MRATVVHLMADARLQDSRTDRMPIWLSKARERPVAWSVESSERPRAATRESPVAWIARSVLEGISRSAECSAPHSVGGELLGYWVTPRAEMVVVDWSGFDATRYEDACIASQGIGPSLRAYRTLQSTYDALRAPLGTWSTRTIAPVDDDGERIARAIADAGASSSAPSIQLLLSQDHSWLARISLTPPHRWPWDALRRPRAVELRVFSPPQR
jgi:hypothetical protein